MRSASAKRIETVVLGYLVLSLAVQLLKTDHLKAFPALFDSCTFSFLNYTCH